MTATPEWITWVAVNIIGCIVYLWLALISWERRIGVLVNKRSMLKSPRLNAVNKQLRYRTSMFAFHIIAAIVGTISMLGYDVPHNGDFWSLIVVVSIVVYVATLDLFGEFRT